MSVVDMRVMQGKVETAGTGCGEHLVDMARDIALRDFSTFVL